MDATFSAIMSGYPAKLGQALACLAASRHLPFYLSGGTVRDWLLGRPANDLDLTVATGSAGWAAELAAMLAATLVVLDEQEAVYRVVWQGITIDFSQFREGTASIEADLRKRDFTINSLAIASASPAAVVAADAGGSDSTIIDPTDGRQDLLLGVIRCTSPQIFAADPLRLLRAYRFMAVLGFSLDSLIAAEVRENAHLIHKVAAERLSCELNLIMASDAAHRAVLAMHESGLLGRLFPELMAGQGMAQPASHHLDVFDHGLAALARMEEILKAPERFFPGHGAEISQDYLAGEARRKVWLKWAALFHDLGKPATWQIREDKGGRITFYNHDRVGAGKFRELATRLKWSNEDTAQVARLIDIHMWPFHLNNVRRRREISARACLKLVKAAGPELTGLFLLAMADCLAGQGPGRPPAMEQSLAQLYTRVRGVYLAAIKPVLEGPRLLDGHDLQNEFNLKPGPLFRKIFDSLEKARVGGGVNTRAQALAWVQAFLETEAANRRKRADPLCLFRPSRP